MAEGEVAVEIAAMVERAAALSTAIGNTVVPPTAQLVLEHAEDRLGHAFEKLARHRDALKSDPVAADALWSLIAPYLHHVRPSDIPGSANAKGPRIAAVEAALLLCTVSQRMPRTILPKVEPLKNDPHVAVRLAFADHFGCFWQFDRPAMWRIAEHIASHEQDSFVLRSLTGFLCRAVHADSARVEDLTFQLLPRARLESDPHGDRMIEAIGSIVAILWTKYNRPRSREVLDKWLAAPQDHEPELSRVIATTRDVLVGGYVSGKPSDIKLRKSAQALASEIVEVTSAGLESFFAIPNDKKTEAGRDSAGVCAKLLDHVGDQLYYSSGANADAGQEVGLFSVATKMAFLRDMAPTLRRIGDFGTPHTIYHLIELLDFLRSADPESVFDLIAHALLDAGQRHGYQFESLATDRFVAVVGVYLADHRDIFKDLERREKLIACLDVFVEAGWPKARRLLYRLPELL